MKAVIVGAGIGGLTAALCFHRLGWEVQVLERAPRLGEMGAGIQISPNAHRLLSALGLEKELDGMAFRPLAAEMRLGDSGRQLFEIPLRDIAQERWGASYLHLHRADLLRILADALEQRLPGSVRTDCAIVGYDQDHGGAWALTEAGASIEGDVVVGADGLHSTIRRQMFGNEAPNFTGNIAWRLVVPTDELGDLAPPPTACIWVGPGRHVVTYRLRGGSLCNFVGVVERNLPPAETWSARGSQKEVLADFDGWHPIVVNLIEKASTHYRWALYDRIPLKRWSDGRVVLLGDASHPVLPTMAQGAAMAIEDAWVLMQQLSANGDVAGGCEKYFSSRIARTSRVRKSAISNAKLFHRQSQLFGYAPIWLAGRLAPELIQRRNDWVFGHDLTREDV